LPLKDRTLSVPVAEDSTEDSSQQRPEISSNHPADITAGSASRDVKVSRN
jgi:hypothetical protein